jgi:hypothetical protein
VFCSPEKVKVDEFEDHSKENRDEALVPHDKASGAAEDDVGNHRRPNCELLEAHQNVQGAWPRWVHREMGREGGGG